MRLTGLLALLLFILIVFFAAAAASHAQTANLPAIKTERPDSNPLQILPDNPHLDEARPAPGQTDRALVLVQPLMEHGGDLVLRESAENDDLCYSMRTYVMAREDKTSDVTHFVRQVKCTPARKFNYKTTELRLQQPADTKPALK
ncbi:MAG TPA: hypothetical protein VNY29_00990 [Terriglobales bacterium]|jgi:hypothetical protein|nr:hypothetical protein [Terriglobales bacterium]